MATLVSHSEPTDRDLSFASLRPCLGVGSPDVIMIHLVVDDFCAALPGLGLPLCFSECYFDLVGALDGAGIFDRCLCNRFCGAKVPERSRRRNGVHCHCACVVLSLLL